MQRAPALYIFQGITSLPKRAQGMLRSGTPFFGVVSRWLMHGPQQARPAISSHFWTEAPRRGHPLPPLPVELQINALPLQVLATHQKVALLELTWGYKDDNLSITR